ncbi:MAG TPA: hypothetical protein VK018_07135, partial [Porticoccaceae bacterium]|nr:hypothetical protein [Porticoccaceae bacterium]
LAIANKVDRFSLAIDAIDRVARLRAGGAHVKEKLRDMQIAARHHAHQYGVDSDDINSWSWPY